MKTEPCQECRHPVVFAKSTRNERGGKKDLWVILDPAFPVYRVRKDGTAVRVGAGAMAVHYATRCHEMRRR